MASRRDIGATLDVVHKGICRAGFLIVTQIVKRRFNMAYSEEALNRLRDAQKELEALIAEVGERS